MLYFLLSFIFTIDKPVETSKQHYNLKKNHIFISKTEVQKEDEIKVTGFIKKNHINENIFSSKQITSLGNPSLSTILKTNSSFQIISNPKDGDEILVDGFDSKSIKFLLNGIPLSEIYDAKFNAFSGNSFLYSSIKIDTGIPSLMEGPNTTGGIIFLNVPDKCKFFSNEVMLKTFNLYKNRFQGFQVATKHCTSFNHWTFLPFVLYEKSNGYRLSDKFQPNENNEDFHEDGGLRNGSKYEKLNIGFNIKKTTTNSVLNVFALYSHFPRQIPPFESADYVRYWKFIEYKNGFFGVNYKKFVNYKNFRKYEISFYAHLHKDKLVDTGNPQYIGETNDELSWFKYSEYFNQTYGIKSNFYWDISKFHKFNTVFSYKIDAHNERELKVGQEKVGNWEKYIMFTSYGALDYKTSFKKWNFSFQNSVDAFGLLYHKINNVSYPVEHLLHKDFESRVLLQRKLFNSTFGSLKFGKKVRLPLMKELFSNHVEGNSELKAEKAFMMSTSVFGNVNKLFQWKIRGFYYKIKDLIQNYRDSFANIGQAKIYGFEVKNSVKLRKFIGKVKFSSKITLSYRFQKTLNVEEQRELDYRSKHKAVLTFTQNLGKKISFGLESIYFSDQKAMWFNSVGGTWEEEHLDGGIVINARIHFKTLVSKYLYTDTFLEVHNLTDTNYMSGSYEPREGRYVILGLKGDF